MRSYSQGFLAFDGTALAVITDHNRMFDYRKANSVVFRVVDCVSRRKIAARIRDCDDNTERTVRGIRDADNVILTLAKDVEGERRTTSPRTPYRAGTLCQSARMLSIEAFLTFVTPPLDTTRALSSSADFAPHNKRILAS